MLQEQTLADPVQESSLGDHRRDDISQQREVTPSTDAQLTKLSELGAPSELDLTCGKAQASFRRSTSS
jgi:hypothetical protein